VHFLALAYIVYHSGLTGLMRRTRAFLPLCLIGRYGLPVFATGTVLSAVGEVMETRSEAFSHEVAFGAAMVVGGILMHYLVARGLAAWRDKSTAQPSMMNRAHTLQMASPLSFQKSAIVLWSGTSPPISPICPSLELHPRVAEMQSGQDRCDDDRHRSLDLSS
ncbi:MAG: OpgC domain-containing protein, partial [Isosphaeraceae bacterium]